MFNRKNYLFNLIIAIMMSSAILISGCASEDAMIDIPEAKEIENVTGTAGDDIAENDEAVPELIDPVGISTNYALALPRDMYDAEVHAAIVCPEVEYYEYTSSLPFEKYGALPGEEVHSGDVLIYSNTEAMDDSIEEIQEAINKADVEYLEYLSDAVVDLSDMKKDEYEASVAWAKIRDMEPESEDDPFYLRWTKMIMPAEGAYKRIKLQRERFEVSMKNREDEFNLDRNYQLTKLTRIDEKKSQALISSSSEGMVVGINFYEPGQNIVKGSECIVLGNVNNKQLKCEFVSKATISKAEEVYALINGKRYEVTYEVMEADEYKRIKARDSVVYSTFYIDDPANEIVLGDFGVIVVVNKSRKNTLCVPIDAVNHDENGDFVYIIDGEQSKRVSVMVGMKDGKYCEIIEGLNENDKIISSEEPIKTKSTKKLETGKVSHEFSTRGFLFYPSSEWLGNPAKTGTGYLKEICIERYQQVKAGDVVARVEVIPDKIEISKIERKIQRQQERLNDIIVRQSKKNTDEVEKEVTRAVREKTKTIDELMKQLEKLKKYSGVINIVAPYDGTITYVADLKEGDLISYKQGIVQIADVSRCFVLVEDKDGQLSYGNKAEVSFRDNSGRTSSIEGDVVTLNPYALDSEMKTGYALIALSSEDAAIVSQFGSIISDGGWWNRTMFNVAVEIRSMDNVVLVPKSAVKMVGKDTYVAVRTKDGDKYVSFVPGGSDSNNYWVAYGLEEGTEICLE